MFGLLLLLVLQGGSTEEPPSAHALRPTESPVAPQEGGITESDRVELYARNLPSLVQVRLANPQSRPQAEALGSEFVLSGVVVAEIEDGALVVVPGKWAGKQAEGLAVYDMAGHRYSAQLKAVAEGLGLSLLTVPELWVEAPRFGFAETLPIGSSIAVIGNGYGLFGSLSTGILSGRARQLEELGGLLQVTNPIHPGDGGGLVLDRGGRLIGIALTSLEDAKRRRALEKPDQPMQVGSPTGISFVIPLSQVLEAFREPLALPASEPRPILGLQVQEAALPRQARRALGLEQRTALFVVRVEKGLPAEKAGLQAGDYLIAMAGRPVRSFACLFSWTRTAEDICPVQFVRDGKLLEREVAVTRRAAQPRQQGGRSRIGTQASPALIEDGGGE